MQQVINKRGYLNQDYMFFHLCDQSEEEHTFHYHEFDKLVMLLSGKVTYVLEGKSYFMQPYDIMLISHHDIHMPLIDKSVPYERIVIWVNHDFISSHSTPLDDLSLCFTLAKKRSMGLMRFPDSTHSMLTDCLNGLEQAFSSQEFASKMMANTYFIQFLIHINRLALNDKTYKDTRIFRYDRKIDEIIGYINSNLSADLSVETLSRTFFISKSYLMHKFKAETGYPLHNYILQKRLLHSKELLQLGTPVVETSEKCGFNDYTTYLRAFKKMFKMLPSELGSIENDN